MQITHPQAPQNGLPAEDMFIVSDDMGTQAGVGYLIYQDLRSRSPECPVNIYFDINSLPSGWYLLLGALVARARILRDQAGPDVPARLYTRVDPTDLTAIEQYRGSGFAVDQQETLVQLQRPEGDGRLFMSCQVQPVPLNTQQEMYAFTERLRLNDITHIQPAYLAQLQRLPHFQALALAQNGTLVGEAVMAGTGSTCELMAVYTAPAYRRQGMAAALVHRMMAVMEAEGVTAFAASINSMSEPQKALAQHFQGRQQQVISIFPYMLL